MLRSAEEVALLCEEAGVEGQGRGEVLGEVGGIVAARVDMKFVWDAA